LLPSSRRSEHDPNHLCREQAVIGAFDDEGNAEVVAKEIKSSKQIERLLLGGDFKLDSTRAMHGIAVFGAMEALCLDGDRRHYYRR